MTHREIFEQKINQLIYYMKYVDNVSLARDFFYTSERNDSGIVKTVDLLEEYKELSEAIFRENKLTVKTSKKEIFVSK